MTTRFEPETNSEATKCPTSRPNLPKSWAGRPWAQNLITVLPCEIFVQILLFTLNGHQLYTRRRHELCLVSVYWRDTINACPQLWSNISCADIKTASQLKRTLRNSKNAPLHIFIFDPRPRSESPPGTTLLLNEDVVSQLHRWKSSYIHFHDPSGWDVVKTRLKRPAPLLQSAELHNCRGDDTVDTVDLFDGWAPELRRLHLGNFLVPSNSGILSSLQSLSLSFRAKLQTSEESRRVVTNIGEVLSSCKLLRELELRYLGLYSSDSVTCPILEMLALRSLKIFIGGGYTYEEDEEYNALFPILQSLSAEACQNFTLSAPVHTLEESRTIYALASTTLRHSQHALDLEMTIELIHTHGIRVLLAPTDFLRSQASPVLSILLIGQDHSNPKNSIVNLLIQMLRHFDKATEISWPVKVKVTRTSPDETQALASYFGETGVSAEAPHTHFKGLREIEIWAGEACVENGHKYFLEATRFTNWHTTREYGYWVMREPVWVQEFNSRTLIPEETS